MTDVIMYGEFPVSVEEEEIVITFDVPSQPNVIKRAIIKETKSHWWIPPWYAIIPLPPIWMYPKINTFNSSICGYCVLLLRM